MSWDPNAGGNYDDSYGNYDQQQFAGGVGGANQGAQGQGQAQGQGDPNASSYDMFGAGGGQQQQSSSFYNPNEYGGQQAGWAQQPQQPPAQPQAGFRPPGPSNAYRR